MNIEIIPCLRDNYCYVLVEGTSAILIDPADTRPVIQAVARLGLEPLAVLCTHHHEDHLGALPALLQRNPSLQVFGHPADRYKIAGLNQEAAHKQTVQIGDFSVLALHTPGHTQGSITWVVQGCAFTGDTLFCAGCGRLLEGTAEQLHTSLQMIVGSLEESTRVYCGHEYTTTNLRFALRIEPNNSAVSRKLEEVLVSRFEGRPTVPSTIHEERLVSPFLRCAAQGVLDTAKREGCKSLDPVSVFAWLRNRKDRFRPSQVGRPLGP